MKFRAIVRQTANGFTVMLPAFPGIRTSGQTQEAALEAAREAIAASLEFDVEQRDAEETVRPVLQVSVTKGSVSREAETIPLRGITLALLVALATNQGEISRAELCERLYPGAPPEQAYNALKMSVHRARQQVGESGIIETTERGYKLGDDVIVDIRFLPQILRALRTRSVANAIEQRLPHIFEDLYAGRPAAYASWEWFAPTERVLERIMREIGLYLGARALRDGNAVAALEHARRLIVRDMLDEGAYDLAIRAHLARGNRASALMEYRAFAGRLREQLGIEPSPAFQRLLQDARS